MSILGMTMVNLKAGKFFRVQERKDEKVANFAYISVSSTKTLRVEAFLAYISVSSTKTLRVEAFLAYISVSSTKTLRVEAFWSNILLVFNHEDSMTDLREDTVFQDVPAFGCYMVYNPINAHQYTSL
ncbi:hypothetical protein CEXT_152731 [Caerostris extrusa]|uniref:Uncharacterized protein n=1 Tax=Caerostris extrusa TaxID=172846 RepID=A0AAV4TCC4_CAEEX|nr:hypothetical protein CEXT_152731 [Caerostris extrusa]